MGYKTLKKRQISPQLEHALKQLEQITKLKTPAHGGEDGREEKEFPRTLGNA